MSKTNPTRYAERRARERVIHNLQLLELEIRMGSPRRHLDVLAELIELLFAHTGPETLETQALRDQFAGAKARIKTRTNLWLVQ